MRSIYMWIGLMIISVRLPAQLTVPAKLDRLMTACTETGLFNGTVLISRHDEILLHKGYGWRDMATGKLNTADTKFPAYSITKSLTATIILRLEEEGKLRTDENIARFFTMLPAADTITIAHLLSHTAGLYTYNNDFSMPTSSEAAMLRFLSTKPLEFPPGTQFRYCNTGYYLLGFIIEKLTGGSYAQALQQYIFRPLNMTKSGIDFTSLKDPHVSTGYQFLYPDSAGIAKLYAYEELRSSGGIWSTASDLYRFHQGMQQHRIISAASTAKAYTRVHNNYAAGWFIDSLDNKQIVSHSGGAAGFRTYLVRIPEDDICIVLLANAENIDLTNIKDQILQVLYNKPYKIPENVKVGEERLASIAGAYQLEPGRILYVRKVKQRLVAQISGQRPVLLLANSNSRFTVAGMDGYLQFPDKQDRVILMRKGKQYEGDKIKN